MSQSLNDIAYTYICKLLVEDRILPNQRLSEQYLAKELGISRTPVREAINRLCGEGILHQVPSSGTYIMEPSIDDVLELYEIREALECYLVKKAVPMMTHADFKLIRKEYETMKDAVEQMKKAGDIYLSGDILGQFLKADWAFHRHLIESADNRHALKILDDTQLKGCVYGIRSHRRNEEHLNRVLRLHRRIAIAVTQGNENSAAHWLRMHIRESRRDAIDAIKKTNPSPAKPDGAVSAYSVLVDRKFRSKNEGNSD